MPMLLKLTTYYKGEDIPDLQGTNTFHSKEQIPILVNFLNECRCC